MVCVVAGVIDKEEFRVMMAEVVAKEKAPVDQAAAEKRATEEQAAKGNKKKAEDATAAAAAAAAAKEAQDRASAALKAKEEEDNKKKEAEAAAVKAGEGQPKKEGIPVQLLLEPASQAAKVDADAVAEELGKLASCTVNLEGQAPSMLNPGKTQVMFRCFRSLLRPKEEVNMAAVAQAVGKCLAGCTVVSVDVGEGS